MEDDFKISPIILFVFARPTHTQKTLDALAKNKLADKSNLIVYSDAPRNKAEIKEVNLVREKLKNLSGFRKVSIIERTENYGLARNIIEGVTEVIKEYGKAIILEDDIVTSPYFLTYMNNSLKHYKEEKQVWHISGWNYPINPKGIEEAFFWRAMNCWGWATWEDRWEHFNKDPHDLIKSWSPKQIRAFNLDGACDFWAQVKANSTGQLNTWAIFWYATIFENGGLCLNPTVSFTRNIGHDGTGENCEDINDFKDRILSKKNITTPSIFVENKKALLRIKKCTNTPLLKHALIKLLRIVSFQNWG